MEAHGTGTKAGDAAEFAGLRMAFDESGRADRQWCALGSVKSQIGHTKAAAGAAGLFKAVMALRHRTLPPTINVANQDPSCDLDVIPNAARQREVDAALCNCLGFGSKNSALVLGRV